MAEENNPFRIANSLDEVFEIIKDLEFPITIRPAFTLETMGHDRYIIYRREDVRRIAQKVLWASPVYQVGIRQWPRVVVE